MTRKIEKQNPKRKDGLLNQDSTLYNKYQHAEGAHVVDVLEYIKLGLVHEIHTSERRSFRACRRRWDWIFRQHYYPLMTAKPLEFGIAFHRAMEVYYNPDTWNYDREVLLARALVAFTQACDEQRKTALALQDRIAFDDNIEQDYDERVDLGKGMLTHYITKISPVEDLGWKPIKVEIPFLVPISNPETGDPYMWCKCDECWTKWMSVESEHPDIHDFRQRGPWQGLPVVYGGRIDMLAEDQHGKYWIFDWKTARSITEQDEFLYLDDQVGSYVWALRKLGPDVRGFVYVEIRKGFPLPPEQNTARRLGRMYSVNKNQTTDYPTYLATIKENDRLAYEKGFYDDFLEYLKNDGIEFTSRKQIGKSEAELLSIEYNLGLEALDMLDPKVRIYPSAGRFGCSFCAFRQPCMEKNASGDYQYALDTLFERREHYYVRTQGSTETKGAE